MFQGYPDPEASKEACTEQVRWQGRSTAASWWVTAPPSVIERLTWAFPHAELDEREWAFSEYLSQGRPRVTGSAPPRARFSAGLRSTHCGKTRMAFPFAASRTRIS